MEEIPERETRKKKKENPSNEKKREEEEEKRREREGSFFTWCSCMDYGGCTERRDDDRRK